MGARRPVTTSVDIPLNEWSHLALFRGGNGATLYMNGSVVSSHDGYWGGVTTVYLVQAAMWLPTPTMGPSIISISAHFADGVFGRGVDIDYFPDLGITFTGIAGDVDQDGLVNDADYLVWSDNAGFNNGFGVGDPGTLIRGDVDAQWADQLLRLSYHSGRSGRSRYAAERWRSRTG